MNAWTGRQLRVFLFFIASLLLFRSDIAEAQSPPRDPKILTLLEQFRLPKTITASKSIQPTIVNNRVSRMSQLNACNTWTFQFKVGNPGAVERVNDIIQLSNSDYLMVGTEDAGLGEQGLVAKFGPQGFFLLSNSFTISGYNVAFKKLKQFSDGKIYFLCDITQTASGITWPAVGSMDTDLNIQWLNKIDVSGLAGSWKAVDLAESDLKQNTFSFVISNGLQLNVTKYSLTTSSIVWSKSFQSRGNLEVVGIGQYYY